jgi:hypothetical protein
MRELSQNEDKELKEASFLHLYRNIAKKSLQFGHKADTRD